MAGNDRGSWFIPEAGDAVLVAFEAGDVRQPYVLGALWTSGDTPPAQVGGDNRHKLLRSRSGATIAIDDADGAEALALSVPGGAQLRLRSAPGGIEIADGNGNSIQLGPGGVTIACAGRLSLRAAAVEVATGTLTVASGIAQFAGVIRGETLVVNSVVSASYSPGAGNLW